MVGNNKSERIILEGIGAKVHKNSGRGQIWKGDGSNEHYVIDVKEYSKSFSISKDMWAKICTDTIRVDPMKEPVLMLVLGDTQKTRLAVIAWSEFEALQELRNG